MFKVYLHIACECLFPIGQPNQTKPFTTIAASHVQLIMPLKGKQEAVTHSNSSSTPSLGGESVTKVCNCQREQYVFESSFPLQQSPFQSVP